MNCGQITKIINLIQINYIDLLERYCITRYKKVLQARCNDVSNYKRNK